MYIPNSFSPDEDDLNDEFGVSYECELESYSLRIFDRWGELLFETNNPINKWNGSLKGTSLAGGIFVYRLSYKSIYEQEEIKKVGKIVMLR